ncbi:MAG TPA: PD-(D/E)XK nuclease family protein [Polyangiaceae bacterium]
MADPSPNAPAVHLPVLQLSLVPASGDDGSPPPRGYYSHSHLARFAQCPLSFQLHYVDRLPADIAPERHFGRVVHAALEQIIRERVNAGREGPIDPELAAAAYRHAWTCSELSDHALFGEGLALVKRWCAREGGLHPARVIGVEVPFELDVGPVRLRGALDRVDYLGDDAIRVRDYKISRLPPCLADAEESLQLAIYDLVARELWPWARRVELGLDLLRHDVVLSFERTDAQREATRRYILATVAQMERGDDAPRPTTLCAHCDHRTQCPAWAEARAGKRTHVGAMADDLPAVAREREEVAVLLKALVERKDALDAVLRAELEHGDPLELEGRRYSLVTAIRRDYPLQQTLLALDAAGVPRREALVRLGAVDGAALKEVLAELAKKLPREEVVALKGVLDGQARCSPVTRLTVRELRP